MSLGICYTSEEFQNFLVKAEELQDVEAQYKVGYCYQEGTGGVTINPDKARRWYERAADRDSGKATYALETLETRTNYDNHRFAKALPLLQKEAEAGDGEALVLLGFCYAARRRVVVVVDVNEDDDDDDYDDDDDDMDDENETKAVECFQKAATEYNNAAGQNHLAIAYQKGQAKLGSDPAHKSRALEWFRIAAAQGHASAQCNLARIYRNGDGVDRDLILALAWYGMAVAQGHAVASFDLQDLLQYLFRRLADHTNYPTDLDNNNNNNTHKLDDADDDRCIQLEQCMHALAYCYEEGIGLCPNAVLHRWWQTQAAAIEEEQFKDGHGTTHNTPSSNGSTAPANDSNDTAASSSSSSSHKKRKTASSSSFTPPPRPSRPDNDDGSTATGNDFTVGQNVEIFGLTDSDLNGKQGAVERSIPGEKYMIAIHSVGKRLILAKNLKSIVATTANAEPWTQTPEPRPPPCPMPSPDATSFLSVGQMVRIVGLADGHELYGCQGVVERAIPGSGDKFMVSIPEKGKKILSARHLERFMEASQQQQQQRQSGCASGEQGLPSSTSGFAAGQMVEVDGLSDPTLNGQTGIVERSIPGNKYVVSLSNGSGKKVLPAQNLKFPSPPALFSPGQTVQLTGLSDTSLEGLCGTVERAIPPGGRYVISIPSVGKKILPAKNLVLIVMNPAPQEEQDEYDPNYPLGACVELTGLSTTDMNGMYGTIIGPSEKNGRIPVKLVDGDRKVKIKKENLLVLGEAE